MHRKYASDQTLLSKKDLDDLSDCLVCSNDVELLEVLLSGHVLNHPITEMFNCDLATTQRLVNITLLGCMSPSPVDLTGTIKCRVGETLDQINSRPMKMVWLDCGEDGNNLDEENGSGSGEEDSAELELIQGWKNVKVTIPAETMCYRFLCIDFGWVTCAFTTDNIIKAD